MAPRIIDLRKSFHVPALLPKYRNIFYTDQLHCHYKYISARLMKEGKGNQCQKGEGAYQELKRSS